MAIGKPESKIPPEDRFITIRDKIPLDKIDYKGGLLFRRWLNEREVYNISDQEFNDITKVFLAIEEDAKKENILSVGISFSYADIPLPKTYDIIFDTKHPNKFWEQKIIVRGAYDHQYFFNELWSGFSTTHCLIQVVGEIPNIFNELPNGEYSLDFGIGLCTKEDWPYVKTLQEYTNGLREKHGKDWWKYYEEYRNQKNKNSTIQ